MLSEGQDQNISQHSDPFDMIDVKTSKMELGILKDLDHGKGLTDNKNNLISPINRTPNQNFINHGL